MDITGPIPKNARGRFYHLDCAPGELAPYILTCGDPDRAQRIARRLTRVDMRRNNREFLTYTGIYRDIPVSVMATGIGAPASAIAIVEAANCVAPVTFIRLGTCGALQEKIEVGDLVITESARRDENTSHAYAPADFVPRAAPEIVAALRDASEALRVRLSCGPHLHHGGFLRRPGASGAGVSRLRPPQAGPPQPGRGPQSGDGDVRLPDPGGGVHLSDPGRGRLPGRSITG